MKLKIIPAIFFTFLFFITAGSNLYADNVRSAGFVVSGPGVTGDYARTLLQKSRFLPV
jgi:hypothetical protein